MYLITTLLQIVHRVCRWKNFENRLMFGEDKWTMMKCDSFLRHSVLLKALWCKKIWICHALHCFVLVVPSRPRAVNITKVAPTFIWLNVQPPEEDGGMPITHYAVGYDNVSVDFPLR